MNKQPRRRTLLRDLTNEMFDAQRRLECAHVIARGVACGAPGMEGLWCDETRSSYRECCKAFAVVLTTIGVTLAASYAAENDEKP